MFFRFSARFEKTPGPFAPGFAPLVFKKRVLVVDENQRGLEILAEMLMELGMDVLLAHSPAAAKTAANLENARNRPVHCCLVSVSLLEASPFLTHEIQTAFSRGAAPVFIGLSRFTDQDAGIGAKFGLKGMLLKPVRKRRLKEMLKKVLGEDQKQAPPTDSGQIDLAEKKPAKSGSKARILLAEDNPVNQKLALAVLGKAGHHIQVAGDGQQALEMYFANPDGFDLILMDIEMPRLSGVQATRRIREKGHRTPVIAMTAHDMRDHHQAFLEAGMNDYISKPIDIRLLLEMVKKWVGNDAAVP